MGDAMATSDKQEAANRPASEALRLHPLYRGKMETFFKCPVRSLADFAIWYTPGVAAPCLEIAKNPDKVYEYTAKENTIAIVSDGTRVLGLGNIGPLAALPVMEGKAMIFKYLGGVDAVPLVLPELPTERIVETVLAVAPSFGGINLEDIAQPKCFDVLDKLRAVSPIPVWHDDQQGTATVILAGLLNALRVVGKELGQVRIVFVGCGASNTAAARLIMAAGADPRLCCLVDSRGILGPWRGDITAAYRAKRRFCEITNSEGRRGGIAEALVGADVLIAASRPGPGVIHGDWIKRMERGAIVFACSNPVPEIWPWEAKAAGAAVVATGRSDFPNQVNNSLGFPGIFRGTLDVRAKTITDEMCLAAAAALAAKAEGQLGVEHILPTMAETEVFAAVATAVGLKAQEQGLAQRIKSAEELTANAHKLISRAQKMMASLLENGSIPCF